MLLSEYQHSSPCGMTGTYSVLNVLVYTLNNEPMNQRMDESINHSIRLEESRA